MDKITIEFTHDKLQEAVTKAFEAALKSDYSNPVKDAVDRALKEKGGDIDIMVKQIISESMTNPKFKEKLGEVVLNNMVAAAMKSNR